MDFLQAATICRTCIHGNENIMKIKNTYINCDNNTIPILDVLNFVSEIQVLTSKPPPPITNPRFQLLENHPDSICSNCVEKAVVVYKFKLQCEQANKFLQTSVQTLHMQPEPHETVTQPVQAKPAAIKPQEDDELDSLIFCLQCNKSFKNKYILAAHMKRHQYKGHFLCSICGKGFNSQSCLRRHGRVHTGEKNYECQVCQKRFPSSNNLKLHSRTHSGVKPYLCTICGKSFSHPTGLTYHMRTHTKEKPYTCDICGKSFAIQCHMDRHRKTHSGLIRFV